MAALSKENQKYLISEVNSLMLFKLIQQLRMTLPDAVKSLDANAVREIGEHFEEQYSEAPTTKMELQIRNEAIAFAKDCAARLLTGNPRDQPGWQPPLL